MPEDKFSFPVFIGLLTPEHHKQIGSALWEFLWCIARVTKDIEIDGEMIGLVLGGKPVKAEEIAKELGVNPETVRRNLQKLDAAEYISARRAPYGYVLQVRNSKKFDRNERFNKNVESRIDKNVESESERSDINVETGFNKNVESEDQRIDINVETGSDINVDSESGESTDLSNLHHKNVESGFDKNVESNKDTKRDTKIDTKKDDDREMDEHSDDSILFRTIENYAAEKIKIMNLPGTDFGNIQELINAKIPLEVIKQGIEQAVENFKPRHPRDRIRSLSYCMATIYDLHTGNQNRETAQRSERGKGFKPAPPVSKLSRTKQEIMDKYEPLRQREEEQRRRREASLDDNSPLPF